ncbi:DUF1315 family protein [Thalassotalea ponticola]|uniref:YeaC family protein n=1 Tax=Thalassotalea ponticola TaxID=1523392 RepID=UPI0025B3CA58|nr:DUF1315 family protein [Thalassotalea ponticola]MDN3651519.1 DUF1315 family protein [Thalassotalea ponticola]
MDLSNVVENMTSDMYERLKHAAETGRWPNGTVVEQSQRESALQLSMAYQAKHLNSDEMLTVGQNGEIVHKSKAELRAQFKKPSNASDNNINADDIARFTDL